MQIIRTRDMVELNDDQIREIVTQHVARELGREVCVINFYQTNNADMRGNRMHAKVHLEFKD